MEIQHKDTKGRAAGPIRLFSSSLSRRPWPSQAANQKAALTSIHWPWDCMLSTKQGSGLERTSRSDRPFTVRRSSTFSRQGALKSPREEGEYSSLMVGGGRLQRDYNQLPVRIRGSTVRIEAKQSRKETKK